MPELEELIRKLSPGALALYKRQLASLPEQERQRAFSRLSGVSELSDILGRPTPIAQKPSPLTTEQQRPGLGQIMAAPEVPLWQKALAGFSWPFQQIHERAIEPFAAILLPRLVQRLLELKNFLG